MNCQILLTQEFLVLESESIFQSEWGNRSMFFSHGTSYSRGVFIVWKTDGGIICESIYCDKEGRVLTAKIIMNSIIFYVVNCS